jgi:hypothetical protein
MFRRRPAPPDRLREAEVPVAVTPPDGQLYRATQLMYFEAGGREHCVQQGAVVFDLACSVHPFRKGREAAWEPLVILLDDVDGMPDPPDQVPVTVEAHAPTGVVTDSDPGGDHWAYAQLRVRIAGPRPGDVRAPEDVHGPAGGTEDEPRTILSVRGPNPFTNLW